MKERSEIDKLKGEWSMDPCWDIEETEGFEDHKSELIEYRKNMEAHWEYKRNNEIADGMQRTGIKDREVFLQIEYLKNDIEKLKEENEKLKDKIWDLHRWVSQLRQI